jgi:hypothetical protein
VPNPFFGQNYRAASTLEKVHSPKVWATQVIFKNGKKSPNLVTLLQSSVLNNSCQPLLIGV